MKATPLAIPDVILLEPTVFGDGRGFFFESFNQAKFESAIGRQVIFVQGNHSRSVKNVLRGLHYQIQQPQGKLVRVVQGAVFDVAVDIRKSSPTFGQWVGEILSEENKCQIWVPEGFARGFVMLSDAAEFLYKTTNYYAPEHERCIVWNDPAIALQSPRQRAGSIRQRPARQIPCRSGAFRMTHSPLPTPHFPLPTPQTGTNPHASQRTSLVALGKSLWRNRQLIAQMTRREVMGRYKGSVMGLAWSFFNPVFMLVVYTFVFSVIFKSRWGVGGEESKTQFAVVLFVGMIVHGLFAEVLNRAPSLILSNVNYVKKVVFPLEILPVIAMGATLFHSLISLGVLLIAFALFNGYLHWTVVLAPLVLLPLVILTLGLAWMLASLGVFLRDVGQTIGIITTVMMFLSPVFYPVTALPEEFRPWLMANPLTFIIEQAREVLIWGHLPNWIGLGIYTLVATAFAWAGYAWFQKTRKGFADVL